MQRVDACAVARQVCGESLAPSKSLADILSLGINWAGEMIRRWVLALLVAAYAAQDAFFAIFATSVKFGWATPAERAQRFGHFALAMNLVQLTLGWVATVLFFVVALRLVRREPALNLYALAFVLATGDWLSLKLGSAYGQAFTQAEQSFDYVMLAVTVLFGVVIWFIERKDPV